MYFHVTVDNAEPFEYLPSRSLEGEISETRFLSGLWDKVDRVPTQSMKEEKNRFPFIRPHKTLDRESEQIRFCKKWSRESDSNQGSTHFECVAYEDEPSVMI